MVNIWQVRGLAHVVFACLVTSFADGCGASINTLKVGFILFYSMAPLRAECQGPTRATEAGVFSRFAISWMQPAVKQKKRLNFSNGRSLTFEIPEILAGWFVDIGPYPAPKTALAKFVVLQLRLTQTCCCTVNLTKTTWCVVFVWGETVEIIRIFTHWLIQKLLAGVTSSRVLRANLTYSCGWCSINQRCAGLRSLAGQDIA